LPKLNNKTITRSKKNTKRKKFLCKDFILKFVTFKKKQREEENIETTTNSLQKIKIKNKTNSTINQLFLKK
jgi:hypothetical protein